MNSSLKIVAFLMAFFCSLALAQEPPKKEEPKKEEPKKEEPKKVPPKVEKIQIPPLPAIDQQRETLELKNRLQNFRDYLKNRILFLIGNLEKFKGFDQNIRRVSPFISGEFLRGNSTNPSADQLSAARKFWVLSPKVPSLMERIHSLSEVQTSVEELIESLHRGLQDPTNYGLPFSPFYHQSLREIRDGFEELEASSPPDLLGSIFKTSRLSIEQEQTKLEEWEKNILEQHQKAFQQAQLKDEKLFEEYARKFPGRKELPLIDLNVSSPERICQDTAGRLYFWSEKENWSEMGTVSLLAQTWRVLKVSGNLPPKGFSRKFCEATFPKVEKTLSKKTKIFSLLVPLFRANYPITRQILGETKPGLALLLDGWKKKGFAQNTELLVGKAFLEEDLITRLEEIEDFYNKNNVVSISLSIAPGTKKDSLVIRLGDKTLDPNSPTAVVPTTTDEALLKGTWNKKPLWEQVVTIKKKMVKVNYPVRLQILPGKGSVGKTDWKALHERLKTRGKKPAPEPSEVLFGTSKVLIVRLPDGKDEPIPFPEAGLPPYRFLYGGEVLVPLALEASLKEKVKKGFLEFDKEYGSYSKLYKTPFSMVRKAIGYKTPFEEVKAKYNNYSEALAQKNREEAISLYEEISGDKNGAAVVDRWIRYSKLIEQYKFESQQEEQDPFAPLYQSSDAFYLQKENIPTDGKLSKAGQLSQYDGTPTKEQLAVMEEISGSLKGLSEGEKYVETLLQGQKDNNQNQIKELKEFLKRDLGPQSNGGNLVNVWVDKRVLTLIIQNTGNREKSIVDIKVNGQFIILEPKKQIKTEKMVLTKNPYTLVIPLQIGYNTLEILAHNTGSDGFNSGTLNISSCTRGKSEQKFYLSELEVATLTIYFPPPDLHLK